MKPQRQWTQVPRGRHLFADAEQAKQTGGMVALYPRSDFAEMLSVPGGEPTEDLHVTLVYLGENVTGISDGGLGTDVATISSNYSEITASVCGHGVFNPDKEPCGVYLIGNSFALEELHSEVLRIAHQDFPELPEQHTPWIPHMTAMYGNPPMVGQYSGPIVFDRIGFVFAGEFQNIPLTGQAMVASHHQWVI